jgi:hypothetical protein
VKNQRVRSFTPRLVLLGWSLAAMSIAGFSGSTRVSADDTVDPNVKVVVVNGAGTDIESAKKDACREAVRQVVGAYVSSKTQTENDELIEDKVISLSSGFVEKIETLKESQADGLVRVRLRATVRISKVLDSLKANRIAVIEVDGGSLGAQLLTTADQKKGEAELIEAAFEGFPAKWFKASPTGKPRLGERGEGSNVTVVVTVTIEPDYEGFVASAVKLDAALRATERPHGKFEVDATTLGPGMSVATSQESATGFLSGVVTGGGRSGQQAKTEAVSFIDIRSAFPGLLQSYPLGSINGKQLMPSGFIPVTFPVKFRGNGRQATWHWYGMKLSEAKKYLAPRFRKPLTCRTVLIDGSAAELAVDTCEIQCMGVGGMKYWEDWQANDWNNQAAVAVAPAAIVGNHIRIDWLIPKFTCERSIVLEEDEVRRLTNVAVTLE